VHVVHAQVEHDQRVVPVERGRQPALAAEGYVDREAAATQGAADEARDVRFVVDDQHAPVGRGLRLVLNRTKDGHIGSFTAAGHVRASCTQN
jgi:hypothetical protein